MPYWDEWSWAPAILKYHAGTLTFADVWAQRNEHRMLFPQLVMLWLDSFGYWSQRRECLFSVVVVTGSLWLLWRIARCTLPLRPALIVVAIGSSFLFSPAQSENWLWGYQIAWFMVDLAVLGAALLLAGPRLSLGVLLAEAALAMFAAFSSAFGLAILPAVAFGLFVRRKSFGNAPLLRWIVVSVLIAMTYLWGWHAGGSIKDLGFAIGLAPRVLHTSIVAGLPLGLAGGTRTSAAFGMLGIALAAVCVVVVGREEDEGKSARAAPWIVMLAYGVVSSAIIGYGRADLGPEQALASRYITCSLMLWVGLVGLGAVRLRWNMPPLSTRIVRGAAVLLALVATVSLFAAWSVGTKDVAAYAVSYRSMNEVLANYRRASDFDLRTLFPNAGFVRTEISALAGIGQLPEIRAAKPVAGRQS